MRLSATCTMPRSRSGNSACRSGWRFRPARPSQVTVLQTALAFGVELDRHPQPAVLQRRGGDADRGRPARFGDAGGRVAGAPVFTSWAVGSRGRAASAASAVVSLPPRSNVSLTARSGRVALQQADEVVAIADLLIVVLQEDVVAAQAGLFRRRIGENLRDENALVAGSCGSWS